MSNKEYIYIEKNTTKIPIQEGYEQKKKKNMNRQFTQEKIQIVNMWESVQSHE